MKSERMKNLVMWLLILACVFMAALNLLYPFDHVEPTESYPFVNQHIEWNGN